MEAGRGPADPPYSLPVPVVINGFYPKTGASEGAQKVLNYCSLNLLPEPIVTKPFHPKEGA
jgi:hypothetical protein